jgi:hypothetical protein
VDLWGAGGRVPASLSLPVSSFAAALLCRGVDCG